MPSPKKAGLPEGPSRLRSGHLEEIPATVPEESVPEVESRHTVEVIIDPNLAFDENRFTLRLRASTIHKLLSGKKPYIKLPRKNRIHASGYDDGTARYLSDYSILAIFIHGWPDADEDEE